MGVVLCDEILTPQAIAFAIQRLPVTLHLARFDVEAIVVAFFRGPVIFQRLSVPKERKADSISPFLVTRDQDRFARYLFEIVFEDHELLGSQLALPRDRLAWVAQLADVKTEAFRMRRALLGLRYLSIFITPRRSSTQ